MDKDKSIDRKDLPKPETGSNSMQPEEYIDPESAKKEVQNLPNDETQPDTNRPRKDDR